MMIDRRQRLPDQRACLRASSARHRDRDHARAARDAIAATAHRRRAILDLLEQRTHDPAPVVSLCELRRRRRAAGPATSQHAARVTPANAPPVLSLVSCHGAALAARSSQFTPEALAA
jgi:hypothetical protein